MDENFKITSDTLLAVEGKDERNFFKALLKHCCIEKTNFQIIDIGGKDKFSDKFNSLYIMEGFDSIKSIGFIRDAEEKPAQSAFASICDILKKKNLPTPDNQNQIRKNDKLTVGIYIMPDNEGTGMLENLCLKSIEDDPINNCVESYIECSKKYQKEDEQKTYNEPKARVQTYLASRSPIKNSLGLGALKDYWNLDHRCFDDIKKFLRELFT